MIEAAYALITFTLGMTVASVVVLIGSGIVNVAGMAFYPLIYNSYEAVSAQVPSNSTAASMLNTAYNNALSNIQQTTNYASIALTTLASVLEIIGFIGAFIILLGLLMNIAFAPRYAAAPGGV
jgi:beta-lactamase regulating signal transducer with metallopeptidase domain